MLFEDKYRTIAGSCEGIYRDKGSRFLGYAFPIRKEADAKSLLTNLKLEHPKARHHCWAYRLSPDKSVYRTNDDGEPSGTAGRPILNAILSKELTNILVVVVRYFGGVLLGVPGLITAYKSATADALAKAEIIELTLNDLYQLTFDYLLMNEVMKIVKEHQISVVAQNMEAVCNIQIAIPKSQLNNLIPKLEKLGTLTYLRTI